jgi:hypothetical protein
LWHPVAIFDRLESSSLAILRNSSHARRHYFPFAFGSAASRASRSALRRLWFAWNSGSA